MFSSINLLFLLSMAITSWVILCYFEQIIEQHRMPPPQPLSLQPPIYNWQGTEPYLRTSSGLRSWLRLGQSIVDTALKMLGIWVLLNYLFKHTAPGDWMRQMFATIKLSYCVCFGCIARRRQGGDGERYVSTSMLVEQYRVHCELQRRRIGLLERQIGELTGMLVLMENEAPTEVYTEEKTSVVRCQVKTTKTKTTTMTRMEAPPQPEPLVETMATTSASAAAEPDDNSMLVWQKYLQMQRYPLKRPAMSKLLEEHHDANPMLNNNNKTPVVVSTEQLQALQGFYQKKP